METVTETTEEIIFHAHRCITLLTPFLRLYRYLTIQPKIYQHFNHFFSFRIATSVSVPVREAQPSDVGSAAAIDGTHIAGGGRSLAWVSAVAGG